MDVDALARHPFGSLVSFLRGGQLVLAENGAVRAVLLRECVGDARVEIHVRVYMGETDGCVAQPEIRARIARNSPVIACVSVAVVSEAGYFL